MHRFTWALTGSIFAAVRPIAGDQAHGQRAPGGHAIMASYRRRPVVDNGYRYPFPPYPTGWYLIARSADVEVGEVMQLRYFGRELILFRNESGAGGDPGCSLPAHGCPHRLRRPGGSRGHPVPVPLVALRRQRTMRRRALLDLAARLRGRGLASGRCMRQAG